MPDRRVLWREDAANDLTELYQFIVEQQGLPDTALAYAHRIHARCEDLADLPFAGRTRDDIVSGLRSIAFESVVILYIVDEDTVTITNVMHRARDYARILRSS